ncbi:MAG: hydantoinase/oxoprolinase family protein [Archaeoglobaceae archaeon]
MAIIGIDAGGTNTDGVLLSENGLVSSVKVPSTPNDVAGIKEVLKSLKGEAESNSTVIDRVVIGTTLILNSALKGEMGKCACLLIPGPGLNPSLAEAGDLNRVVGGYIDHRGRKVEELDLEGVKNFRDEAGRQVETYAVVGKFSVRNPVLEDEAANMLNGDGKTISRGHEVSSDLRFPIRASTTVLNAKSKPIFEGFASDIEDVISELGIDAPLYFIKSDGAMLSREMVSQVPSVTIKSGPAVSTLGLFALTGAPNTITIDIGGTTTDIGLISDGEPEIEDKLKIAGFKTPFSSIKSADVALGGDSHVEIEQGEIKIRERRGQSAAFGGDHPTVTDALHVLGEFVQGDRKRSEEAMNGLAGETGLDVEELSIEVVNKFSQQVSQETQDFLKEHGKLDNKKELTILGGGVLSRYLLPRIAHNLGHPYVVPHHAEVAGAVGCAVSRVSLKTGIHMDTAQGVMTVNGVPTEVEKGKRFSESELMDLAREEAKKVSQNAGASHAASEDVEIKSMRYFNVVEMIRVSGQISDIEAQVKPGISSRVNVEKLRR